VFDLSTGSQSRRHVKIPLLVCAFFSALGGLAAGGASAAILLANTPSPDCPVAPRGWTAPPAAVGKIVVDSGNSAGPGGDRTQVNCNYFGVRGGHVDVVVSFALPTDINPVADSYFGCSSGVTPWTTSGRMFVAISRDRWAVVAFSDPAGYLTPADVPGFEQVAHQLLRNTEPYAHTCAVNPVQTSVSLEYSYAFSADGAHGGGLFWVHAASSAPTGAVVQAGGANFSVRVSLEGKTRTLAITVTRGVAFRAARPGSAGELRLGVRLVSRSVAGCGAQTAGTLTLSTVPSIRLAICGQTFLKGRARVTISQV
jgi:hypothetical protein